MPSPRRIEAELKAEIALRREFASLDEQALLAFIWTEVRLHKISYTFFEGFGLTDAQFNALMILRDYRRLHQWELAAILVVNRASAGSVLDRLVRRGLVRREEDAKDRRANFVSITAEGERLLNAVVRPYYRLLPDLFKGMSASDKHRFLELLHVFRGNVRALEGRLETDKHRPPSEAGEEAS